MKIIAFAGPKQSGKDTCYEILKQRGLADGKIDFAGPLKRICAKSFELPLETFYDRDLKDRPFEKPVVCTGEHLDRLLYAATDYLEYPYTGKTFEAKKKVRGTVFNSPREMLQIIGTDFFRKGVDENFHTAATFHPAALHLLDLNGTYCVTDIRFVNEHKFLEERFGNDYRAFYVHRPKAEAVSATHESELECRELKNILTNIDNSNDYDTLSCKVLNMYGEYYEI